MVTLACSDYSPEDNHNWKSHIGPKTFHEQVHRNFHKDVRDTFDYQSRSIREGEKLY